MDPEGREGPDRPNDPRDVDDRCHDRGHDQHRERDGDRPAATPASQTPARDRPFPRCQRDDAQTEDPVGDHDPPDQRRSDQPGGHARHERQDQEREQCEVRSSPSHGSSSSRRVRTSTQGVRGWGPKPPRLQVEAERARKEARTSGSPRWPGSATGGRCRSAISPHRRISGRRV